MVDKQQVTLKSYAYVKNGLKILLALVPGVPQESGVIVPLLELVFNHMSWAGLFKNDLTMEQRVELEKAVRGTFKDMHEQNSTSTMFLPASVQKNLVAYVTNLSVKEHISNDISKNIVDIFKQSDQNGLTDVELNKFVKNFLVIFNDKLYRTSLAGILNREAIIELGTRIDNLPCQRINCEPVFKAPYNLTPFVPSLEPELIGRAEFIDTLCNTLKSTNGGNVRIQLIGMGGIGKSEIINSVYAKFVKKPVEHSFDHVAFVPNTGTLDNSLVKCIACPGEKTIDSVWKYLQDLCNTASVLLLIDDRRPDQTKKEQRNAQDEPLSKLRELKATMLIAFRTPRLHGFFEHMSVPSLTVSDCVAIFEKQCGVDRRPLSDVDRTDVDKIIADKAGCNTLLVKRLGSMVYRYGWTIDKFKERLEQKGFNFCTAETDVELQEEINKLYDLKDNDYENDDKKIERNLLEAFALISDKLEQNTCIAWLCGDAGVTEDICRDILKKLSNGTWLNLSNDKLYFYHSMHQMVKAAVISQTKIVLDGHRNLVKHLSDAISIKSNAEISDVGLYIPHASSLAQYFYFDDRNYSVELANLMFLIGKYYKTADSQNKCLNWCNKALEIYTKMSDKKSNLSNLFELYTTMASAHEKLSDYAMSLGWYQKSYQLFKQDLPHRIEDIKVIEDAMAEVYGKAGFNEPFTTWLIKINSP